MKTLKATLAISALVLALAAVTAEAKPPSQVPSGYQSYLTQKEKEADHQRTVVRDSRMKTVALSVEGSQAGARTYHARKHGGGGYPINR